MAHRLPAGRRLPAPVKSREGSNIDACRRDRYRIRISSSINQQWAAAAAQVALLYKQLSPSEVKRRPFELTHPSDLPAQRIGRWRETLPLKLPHVNSRKNRVLWPRGYSHLSISRVVVTQLHPRCPASFVTVAEGLRIDLRTCVKSETVSRGGNQGVEKVARSWDWNGRMEDRQPASRLLLAWLLLSVVALRWCALAL